MDVHYVWIGEPCIAPVRDGSSLFHDVAGPTMLSRVWGGGPNRIHFWCLRAHAPLYRRYFENTERFPNPILVHPCEDFLEGLSRFRTNLLARGRPIQWDPALLDGVEPFCHGTGFVENLMDFATRAPADFLTNLLNTYFHWIFPAISDCVTQNVIRASTPAILRIRRLVNFKNLMSFIILHFCGGYFLDSNVFPWQGIGAGAGAGAGGGAGAGVPTHFPNVMTFKTVAYPSGEEIVYQVFTIDMRGLTSNPFNPIPPAIVWANKGNLVTIIDEVFEDFGKQAGAIGTTLRQVNCTQDPDVWLMSSPAFDRDALAALSNFLFLMDVAENLLQMRDNIEDYRRVCGSVVTLAAMMGYSDEYVRDDAEPEARLDPFWYIDTLEPMDRLVGVPVLGLVKYRLDTHGTRKSGAGKPRAVVPLIGPAAVPLTLPQLIQWQALANPPVPPAPPMPIAPIAAAARAFPAPAHDLRIAEIRSIVRKIYDDLRVQDVRYIYKLVDVPPNEGRTVSRLLKCTLDGILYLTLDIYVDMTDYEIQRAIFRLSRS